MSSRYDVARRELVRQLRRNGRVISACRAAGISRTSFYRWRDESPEFRSLVDGAIEIGKNKVARLYA